MTLGRSTRRCIFVAIPALLAVTLSFCAQKPQTSDRERDGLFGPVRTVSSTREPRQLNLQLPDGPGIPTADTYLNSDYDQDGRRTRSGLPNNSTWSRYVKDSTGAVIEQIDENARGELGRRALFGPFGPTEVQVLRDGHWQTQEINRYDDKGNVVESLSFDADGSLLTRRETTFDEHGLATEDWLHGPNNSFSWHIVHTYDRKSKFETYTSFHEDGSTDVTFVVQGSKVLSYWQSAEKGGPGSLFMMDTGPKTTETRIYKSDGSFGRGDYSYLDEGKRNIIRAEIYDSANELKATRFQVVRFDIGGIVCSRVRRHLGLIQRHGSRGWQQSHACELQRHQLGDRLVMNNGESLRLSGEQHLDPRGSRTVGLLPFLLAMAGLVNLIVPLTISHSSSGGSHQDQFQR